MADGGSDFQARMLAREGVVQVSPDEVQPNDLMLRLVAPDGVIPSGWTILTDGVIWRRALNESPLWPLPDYVLREVVRDV